VGRRALGERSGGKKTAGGWRLEAGGWRLEPVSESLGAGSLGRWVAGAAKCVALSVRTKWPSARCCQLPTTASLPPSCESSLLQTLRCLPLARQGSRASETSSSSVRPSSAPPPLTAWLWPIPVDVACRDSTTHGTRALSSLNQFRRFVRALLDGGDRQASWVASGPPPLSYGVSTVDSSGIALPGGGSLGRLFACSTCSGPHRAESNGMQCQGQTERGKLTSC
jgi:hypothetical protein